MPAVELLGLGRHGEPTDKERQPFQLIPGQVREVKDVTVDVDPNEERGDLEALDGAWRREPARGARPALEVCDAGRWCGSPSRSRGRAPAARGIEGPAVDARRRSVWGRTRSRRAASTPGPGPRLRSRTRR